MKRHLSTTHLWLTLVVLLSATAFAAFSFTPAQATATQSAQPAATPPRYTVRITQVKMGMGREYEALLKNEMLPAFKKAGLKQHSTWTTANLGEGGEYISVRPLESLKQFDEPGLLNKALGDEGARALTHKWSQMVSTTRQFTVQAKPELSIPPKTNEAPKLAVVYRVKVAPFRVREYEDHFKTYSLPQFRKTEQKGFLMSRVTFGGDSYEYIGMFLVDSFTDMGKWAGSFANAGNGQGEKLVGIVVQQESAVYRYVPEMSIRPEAQKAAQ